MQLAVKWTAAGPLLDVELEFRPDTPAEETVCGRWCTAHRPTRLVVDEADFEAWQRHDAASRVCEASALLRPSVVLWDRPFVCCRSADGQIQWREQLPATGITRQLLRRLAAATTLDEIELTIEQLLLEQQLFSYASPASTPPTAHSA